MSLPVGSLNRAVLPSRVIMRALHRMAQILTVHCTISRQEPSTGGEATSVDRKPPFAPGDDHTTLRAERRCRPGVQIAARRASSGGAEPRQRDIA